MKKNFVEVFILLAHTQDRIEMNNGPFAASGHREHAGGQAAHWDIQNKENSNLS